MQFSTLVSIALSFAAVVCAQQKAGQNAFTHPLGGTIDGSEPLILKWTPTTTGTITIKLLKGPTTNILDIDIIATYIENSGSYTWNIPQSLQDSGSMPEGDKYGLKILDDATGTYEYSPPFDISVPGSTYGGASGSSGSSASSAIESTSKKATSTSTSAAESTSVAQKTTAIAQSATATATATPTIIQEQPAETEASAAATTFATKTTAAAAKATSTSADAEAEVEAAESQSSPPNILFIAGLGAGGIVLCGFIILGLCMCCRSKKRKSNSPIENSMTQRQSMMYGNGTYNRV
ncbi:Ser-Thr-rich glycosyl-phosphatidyl-inositol-anchored membrane family-domain-containing protein [Morchella snyderi]|nr:Ser-Thr-rich glycosyl-phosphatidyl-inositol-anchored membrane family-domain-containing protein [Morchella snyderi]